MRWRLKAVKLRHIKAKGISCFQSPESFYKKHRAWAPAVLKTALTMKFPFKVNLWTWLGIRGYKNKTSDVFSLLQERQHLFTPIQARNHAAVLSCRLEVQFPAPVVTPRHERVCRRCALTLCVDRPDYTRTHCAAWRHSADGAAPCWVALVLRYQRNNHVLLRSVTWFLGQETCGRLKF